MLSDDIKNQITAIEKNLGVGGMLAQAWHEAQNNQYCYNSQMCAAKRAFFQSTAEQVRQANTKLGELRMQLSEQLQKEATEARNALLTESPKVELPSIETISNTIQNKNVTPLLVLGAGILGAIIILK